MIPLEKWEPRKQEKKICLITKTTNAWSVLMRCMLFHLRWRKIKFHQRQPWLCEIPPLKNREICVFRVSRLLTFNKCPRNWHHNSCKNSKSWAIGYIYISKIGLQKLMDFRNQKCKTRHIKLKQIESKQLIAITVKHHKVTSCS